MRNPASFLTVLLYHVLRARTNSPCSPNAPAFSEADVFSARKFDYLVIGGGTAGVALSARLAEDPTITVGLIEAGSTHFDDPIVDAAANSPAGNSTYDWMFVSTPQPFSNGRQISLPRGKMLGGSSAINGMAWDRGSSPEYDSWNSFAPDAGWTWDDMLPYLKKAESYSLQPPNPYPGISSQASKSTAEDLTRVDGFSGPIVASYNSFYFETIPAMVRTMNGVGIPTNPEPQAGSAIGVTNTLLSFDRKIGRRSYPATTYFCSHSQYPNYHVLLNAQATKVLFSDSGSGLTATGVEFIANGETFTATASREVVLSAGVDKTPQILELSGIGNSSIIRALNIQALIDLPGVGENWQDHVVAQTQWKLKPGVDTFDILRNNATFAAEAAAQYAANQTGILTAADHTLAFVPLSSIVNNSRLDVLGKLFDQEQFITPVQKQQASYLREWITSNDVSTVELIGWNKGITDPMANESYVTMLGVLVHPLSRGSVHIVSDDPLTPPSIDPNFLSSNFDSEVLLDILKFMMAFGAKEPFASLVAAQTSPDPSIQSDDELLNYIRSIDSGASHHIGTAAMAPRELGGVVDGTLKVYGTTNLRIVDASIFPNQLGAHTQATVYAVAEKAADLIKDAR